MSAAKALGQLVAASPAESPRMRTPPPVGRCPPSLVQRPATTAWLGRSAHWVRPSGSTLRRSAPGRGAFGPGRSVCGGSGPFGLEADDLRGRAGQAVPGRYDGPQGLAAV